VLRGRQAAGEEVGLQELLVLLYPWAKSLHIVSFVAWMAGLFYLPRLFVYHAEQAASGSVTAAVFQTMERKLLRLIMNPAMIATWAFGIVLLVTPGTVAWGSEWWILVKLALVGALTWFHHWCGRRRRDFAAEANTRSGRTFRLMNEVPTLAMIGIVILAVVKPF
jgi:protoporphyrinogen IX oxidase